MSDFDDYLSTCQRKLALKHQADFDAEVARKEKADQVLAAEAEATLNLVRSHLPECLRDRVSFDDAPYGDPGEYSPSTLNRVYVNIGVGVSCKVTPTYIEMNVPQKRVNWTVNGLCVYTDSDAETSHGFAWLSSHPYENPPREGIPAEVFTDIDLAVGEALRRETVELPNWQNRARQIEQKMIREDTRPRPEPKPSAGDVREKTLDNARLNIESGETTERAIWAVAQSLFVIASRLQESDL